ncbi:MAG: endo-1,4-beta-xylanase, partial [Lachnospiraceae bacterium]|nr:endo-1,4-beta-xylanase [Lachnospiraceae bacterium]
EGAAVEGNTLTFAKEWNEYWFALRKPIVCEKIKSLKVKVKDQGLTVAFKLYDKDGNEIKAFYDGRGKEVYDIAFDSDKEVTNIAVMAMNGQDDVFPASITIESVEIIIDTTPVTVEKGVEYDIVNLRDEMCKVLGEDFIVGTAISYDEWGDPNDMALTTKHFNGVTLGNELKPDAMLKSGAEIVTIDLNGEEIQFPVLNFSTPDSRLDYFVDWNNEHPDKKIRIRGHVLVWHSQTPDFFFREDYDTSKDYVTPEVMNKRLEAYIRAVCEHYTSADSKYKDLFYGWDVVNEAVSDGTGTYRNASENSTWWRVYGSPEFINNAFVYANKYMPANIALFYNDYNAYQPGKAAGILTLIENVKKTPGSRIDGMGMQAHYYNADNNPTMEAVKKAAKAYGEVVDQVQFTEIDFKGSTGPDDEQLAKRYKDLYDTVRRLIEEGTNVTGFTVWGVVDKHSWLQTANGAGGGSNGSSKQYPLLFDNNYKAKPAFYALCNAGELEPEIKNVSMVQKIGNLWCSEEYSLKGDAATFTAVWNEGEIEVLVKVKDETADDNDSFTVYAYNGENIYSCTMNRADSSVTEEGYAAIVSFEVGKESIINNKIKLDVVVTDGEKKTAFCDTTFSQETSDKYYAVVTTKPLLGVNKGTVKIDGLTDDEAWASVESIPLTINLGADVSATAKLLWDEEYLYVLMDVKDSVLNKDASQKHEQDSVEIFIDENNGKTGSYQEDDKQYRINYENERSFNGTKCLDENVLSAAVLTEEGYLVEAAFKWTDIEAMPLAEVGLELQVNDANANGTRSGTLSWADKTGNGWSAPEVFGTILLVDNSVPAPNPGDTPAPEPKNGVYEENGGLYYYENNQRVYAGLIEMCDNSFCYVIGNGVVFRNGHYYVKLTNGIMDSCHADFDENGRMLINGIKKVYDGDRFYKDGYLQKDAGVVKVGAYFYYVDAEGYIVKDATVDVVKTNGRIPTGTYRTEKGHLVLDGVLTVDGKTAYYKDNKIGHRAGLVEDNGAFYYVIENGALAKGFVTVSKTNGLKEYGVYEFDAEGKMITDKNGFVDENGSTYYYVNGKRTYAGLVEVDGSLYYVAGDCKLVKGRSYYITHTHGLISKSTYAVFGP